MSLVLELFVIYLVWNFNDTKPDCLANTTYAELSACIDHLLLGRDRGRDAISIAYQCCEDLDATSSLLLHESIHRKRIN